MNAMASQITCVSVVYSTVVSDADPRIHQSSASLAFVRGIHRWPVNSPPKRLVTRTMFPFDDVIMKELTKDTDSSPVRANYGVNFVNSGYLHFYFCPVCAVNTSVQFWTAVSLKTRNVLFGLISLHISVWKSFIIFFALEYYDSTTNQN